MSTSGPQGQQTKEREEKELQNNQKAIFKMKTIREGAYEKKHPKCLCSMIKKMKIKPKNKNKGCDLGTY